MSFAARIQRSPVPYQREIGREAAARFGDHDAAPRQLIAGAAGCSPYLSGLIQRHADWLNAALDAEPTQVRAALMAEAAALGVRDIDSGLRGAKARLALYTALADLGGVWTLEEVTGALSAFADIAVAGALAAAVDAETQRGKLPPMDRPAAGIVALAMGKMGAGELNYSSDIDLIVLVDGAAHGDAFQDRRPALVRATRRMARLLSDITAEGYVFRTDLRLRPDASVTPVCLSMAAAESYYESVGRTWERAAYIKARAAAGDVAAGEAFLRRLTPFVWRKHLDYAAIQDAHDMRLRIRAHKGLHGPITLPGHNMKLGRGGIREIEFFTQTRQLIAGGREPQLRRRGTVPALAALAAGGWVAPEAAEALTDAYRAHREVEHRVQMIGDAQTHDLPGDDAGFDRLAALMGTEAGALRADLADRVGAVHALTEGFFAPAAAAPPVPVPTEAERVVDGWYSYPALRSARAVEVFERLKPELLSRLQRAAQPLDALEQFDLFLAGLPAGVQVFSLFEANPQLIDLFVDIATAAPSLARYLGRNAQVFDAVIGGGFFAPWPGMAALVVDLGAHLDAQDYERQLDAARRWHKEWHFRVGVHFLRGLMDAEAAGRAYADLAEAVLRALWPIVVAEFARKHGAPPGAGAAVIGMGSLGAGQLSATSDLDLIMIYDPQGADASDGPRPLEARRYYARLTQAFVTAISAQTAEGALYEVDMRLRPSGRQGPVATSLAAFESYQQTEAWTWEHLALTRARAVAGSAALGDAVEAVRLAVLAAPRDGAKLRGDVAEMRARLAEAAVPEPGDAKRGAGRLQDIELLAQANALLCGSPARATTAQLGARGAGAHGMDAGALLDSYRWLWALQASGRLLAEGALDMAALGEGGRAFLQAQTGAQSHEALAQALDARAAACAQVIDAALAPGAALD